MATQVVEEIKSVLSSPRETDAKLDRLFSSEDGIKGEETETAKKVMAGETVAEKLLPDCDTPLLPQELSDIAMMGGEIRNNVLIFGAEGAKSVLKRELYEWMEGGLTVKRLGFKHIQVAFTKDGRFALLISRARSGQFGVRLATLDPHHQLATYLLGVSYTLESALLHSAARIRQLEDEVDEMDKTFKHGDVVHVHHLGYAHTAVYDADEQVFYELVGDIDSGKDALYTQASSAHTAAMKWHEDMKKATQERLASALQLFRISQPPGSIVSSETTTTTFTTTTATVETSSATPGEALVSVSSNSTTITDVKAEATTPPKGDSTESHSTESDSTKPDSIDSDSTTRDSIDSDSTKSYSTTPAQSHHEEGKDSSQEAEETNTMHISSVQTSNVQAQATVPTSFIVAPQPVHATHSDSIVAGRRVFSFVTPEIPVEPVFSLSAGPSTSSSSLNFRRASRASLQGPGETEKTGQGGNQRFKRRENVARFLANSGHILPRNMESEEVQKHTVDVLREEDEEGEGEGEEEEERREEERKERELLIASADSIEANSHSNHSYNANEHWHAATRNLRALATSNDTYGISHLLEEDGRDYMEVAEDDASILPDDMCPAMARGFASHAIAEVQATPKDIFLTREPLLKKTVKYYANALPPEMVVARARAAVGSPGWNPITRNCEHFATWAKTGRTISTQVYQVSSNAAVLGASTMQIIVTFSFFGLLLTWALGKLVEGSWTLDLIQSCLAWLLKAGVLLSSLIFAFGLLVSWGNGSAADFDSFVREKYSSNPSSPSDSPSPSPIPSPVLSHPSKATTQDVYHSTSSEAELSTVPSSASDLSSSFSSSPSPLLSPSASLASNSSSSANYILDLPQIVQTELKNPGKESSSPICFIANTTSNIIQHLGKSVDIPVDITREF